MSAPPVPGAARLSRGRGAAARLRGALAGFFGVVPGLGALDPDVLDPEILDPEVLDMAMIAENEPDT